MRKFNEARFVTFEEDYKIKTKAVRGQEQEPKTLFKKGQRVAMSVKVAEKLKSRKAKLRIEEIDFKAIWAKLKERKKSTDKSRLVYG